MYITHPDIVFYDFYQAWDEPNPDDKAKYLDERAGILAQAAPNIGPVVSFRPLVSYLLLGSKAQY